MPDDFAGIKGMFNDEQKAKLKNQAKEVLYRYANNNADGLYSIVGAFFDDNPHSIWASSR